MDEQLEFLKLVARRLDSAGISYMLTGSMAMAVYSIPRMTRDIDLVVEIDTGDIEKIVHLFSEDCYIDPDSIRQALQVPSMFNIIHTEWIIKADFIIRKDEEYRKEEFSRRQNINIEDTIVSIVSIEDLILSKLVWGKQSYSNIQKDDVRLMLSTISTMNWPYLEKWAFRLEVASLLKEARGNG